MQTRADPAILRGVRCTNCKKLFIPPKYACPNCGNTSFEEVNYTGKGKIHTYAIIRIPPESHKDQAPYIVAVIKLKEGLFVTGRLLNWDEGKVEIGAQVMFARKNGSGYWFKLI